MMQAKHISGVQVRWPVEGAMLKDELTSTKDGLMEWNREASTVDVTELICSLIEKKRRTWAWVANSIGVSERRFTAMMSGDTNINIRQLADIFTVLDATIKITAMLKRSTEVVAVQATNHT